MVKRKKKKVLLTGASGSMGAAAFRELLARRDEFDIVLLVRPSAKNKNTFRSYEGGKSTPAGQKGVVEHRGLKIVWGDLTDYDDVAEAVRGVDFVLHPAAFISPAADHNPPVAEKINVGSARNLVAAIKAEPGGAERIRLVNISSVAMYGDRLPPIHMVRCGDPFKPSVFDFYATTKIRAERIVVESGLKYWATIRQTYIAIGDALSLMDPIMFHQPLDTHMELVTDADAGYGLVRCLDCPDDFYGRIYNMSGGPSCRVVYRDYLADMMQRLGMGDFRKIMEPDWFCLRNFHCSLYEDSDVLDSYLGHQRQSLQDHYQQVLDAAPWYVPLGRLVPSPLIKHLVMKPMANRKDGPLYWVNQRKSARISAFYGSLDKVRAIGGWENDKPLGQVEPQRLEHGYDEDQPSDQLTIDDLREAARFRGGDCLSDEFLGMSRQLRFKCAFEHEFEATPTLVLKAGHWCPECLAPSWNYDEIAQKNPFFAQIYYPNHEQDERNFYDERCFEDIL